MSSPSKRICSRIALLSGLLLSQAAGLAQAGHVDPAPIDDVVVQKLVQERLATPDPLPGVLSARLDEAAALIGEVARSDARPNLSRDSRESLLASKRMLLSAKKAELESLRGEARARLASTRNRFESLGLADKVKAWDELTAKVENRFDRVTQALEGVRSAGNTQARARALTHARKEFESLHQVVPARDTVPLPNPGPGRGYMPTPAPIKTTPTEQTPQYLGYRYAPENNVYAFLGDTLLAALPPPVPASATTCGTQTELDAALAATQDVQITQEIKDLAAEAFGQKSRSGKAILEVLSASRIDKDKKEK